MSIASNKSEKQRYAVIIKFEAIIFLGCRIEYGNDIKSSTGMTKKKAYFSASHIAISIIPQLSF